MIFICKLFRISTKPLITRNIGNATKLEPPWKILFFGSDEFSLSSLNLLNIEYKSFRSLADLQVVSGRKPNPIRKFALKENLVLHDWPYAVPTKHEFHLGIVVSFGHLIPKGIIEMFPLGMLNVHASLLPRWRGAAPIIYAIANGDKETGVTIMQIEPEKFDIGDIIMQRTICISDDITMPEVHKQLAQLGASTLIESIHQLPSCLEHCNKQSKEGVTLAPRINNTIAQVHWNRMTAKQVYDLSRALTGLYSLYSNWNGTTVKLINIKPYRFSSPSQDHIQAGRVHFIKEQNLLVVQCNDGQWISVEKVGVSNKKPMTAKDFYNGYITKETIKDRIFK